MFTTTNVATTSASVGGGGPVAAAVPHTFQIISAPINGSPSSSSSSTTLIKPTVVSIINGNMNIASQTVPSSSLSSSSSSSPSLIKPSFVSITNGNMNVATQATVPLISTGATIPKAGNIFYITTPNLQHNNSITTANINLQTPQTIRLVPSPIHGSSSAPILTLLNNSNTAIINNPRQIVTASIISTSTDVKPGTCIGTPTLGQLATIANQRQITTGGFLVQQSQSLITNNIDNSRLIKPNSTNEKNNSNDACTVSNDDKDLINNSQDQEIEMYVNNVVCSFTLGCKLNLRKIAMEGANVIFKRDQAMLLMKIRKPYCSANIWSSGKVTVTGTTSEGDAKRAARRIARSLQRLGYKVKFRHYRVVNCLATCTMPWHIDIMKLSRLYSNCVSYEPEIHPGATVRLPEKAVLKVFTTGSVTLTAPSVERINTAVNEFYPQLFECRKLNYGEEQR